MFVAYTLNNNKVKILCTGTNTIGRGRVEDLVEKLLTLNEVVWDEDDGDCTYEQAIEACLAAQKQPGEAQLVNGTQGVQVVWVKPVRPAMHGPRPARVNPMHARKPI